MLYIQSYIFIIRNTDRNYVAQAIQEYGICLVLEDEGREDIDELLLEEAAEQAPARVLLAYRLQLRVVFKEKPGPEECSYTHF
mgnify:CR=1 FL=1